MRVGVVSHVIHLSMANIKPVDAIEVLEKRTEGSKTFDLGAGSFSLEAYSGPIHFKEIYDDKHEWQDIDPTSFIDQGDHIEYDKMPTVVRVFKDRTGYEVESRRTGHKFTVELVEVDGIPTAKRDPDSKLDFQFETRPSGTVRLWKNLKTLDAPRDFKWKITEDNVPTKKVDNELMAFREKPEAFDINNQPIQITTEKIDHETDEKAFYWKETIPLTATKVDTDVDYNTGAGDGHTYKNDSANWDTTHDATDSTSADYTSTTANLYAAFVGGVFHLTRVFLPFDTSGLDDAATIDGGVLTVRCSSIVQNNGTHFDAGVVQTTQASNTVLANADFDQCGAVDGATEGATRVAITTTGAKVFTLNATGISWISKTGFTKLGIRTNQDLDDFPVVDNTNEFAVQLSMSEDGTAGNRPKLTVTYHLGTAYTKTISETLVLAATILKAPRKIATETMTLTATILKRTIHVFSNSLTVTATILKKPRHIFSDALTVVDTMLHKPRKIIANSISLTDTMGHLTRKILNDSISLIASLVLTFRVIITDVLHLRHELLTKFNDIFTNLWSRRPKDDGDGWSKQPRDF